MQIIEIGAKKFSSPSAAQRKEVEEKIKVLRKQSEKLVRGTFEFVDAGGGWFDFDYRFLPGDPIRTVKIIHGEVVDIPIILARHLNNCYRKIRTMAPNGAKGSGPVEKYSRTRFIQQDWIDDPMALEKPVILSLAQG